MSAQLFYLPFKPAFTSRGLPAGAAKVFFYASGTTTAQAVYGDAALTQQLANPVQTDALGMLPTIYMPSASVYRVRVTDVLGAAIGNDVDPYIPGTLDGLIGPPGAAGNVALGRAALAAIPATSGSVWFLSEGARSGNFAVMTGVAPSDPLQGLYIPLATPGYYAARVWNGIEGQPEWWGAQTNNGGYDNLSALNACLSFCHIVALQAADYYISTKWTINTSYRSIIAPGIPDHYAVGHGARIISTDGTANCAIQIGPDTPANPDPSTYTTNIHVSGVVALVQGANPPAAGSYANGIAGWNLRYVKSLFMRHCVGAEVFIGFRCYGLTGSHLEECFAFRSASTGTANDVFIGFYCQGTPPVLAGGNASLYFRDCASTVGGNPPLPAGSWGFLAEGAFTDMFVDGFETSGHRTGMRIDGQDYKGLSSGTQGDLKLNGLVLDTCSSVGLQIANINQAASIDVGEPYVGLLGGGTANMSFENCSGGISMNGGRLIGSGDAPGVRLMGANGVRINGTKATDCGGSPLYIIANATGDGSTNFDIQMILNNPNNTAKLGTVPQPACTVRNSARGRLTLVVKGKAGAYTAGVYLDTNCDLIEVNATGLNINCVPTPGGIPNKVQIGNNTITAPGYYKDDGTGTTTAGTGINVTGILS